MQYESLRLHYRYNNFNRLRVVFESIVENCGKIRFYWLVPFYLSSLSLIWIDWMVLLFNYSALRYFATYCSNISFRVLAFCNI